MKKTNSLIFSLLFLSSAGALGQNVGIGTLSPADKLHVFGNTTVEDDGNMYKSSGNLLIMASQMADPDEMVASSVHAAGDFFEPGKYFNKAVINGCCKI